MGPKKKWQRKQQHRLRNRLLERQHRLLNRLINRLLNRLRNRLRNRLHRRTKEAAIRITRTLRTTRTTGRGQPPVDHAGSWKVESSGFLRAAATTQMLSMR